MDLHLSAVQWESKASEHLRIIFWLFLLHLPVLLLRHLREDRLTRWLLVEVVAESARFSSSAPCLLVFAYLSRVAAVSSSLHFQLSRATAFATVDPLRLDLCTFPSSSSAVLVGRASTVDSQCWIWPMFVVVVLQEVLSVSSGCLPWWPEATALPSRSLRYRDRPMFRRRRHCCHRGPTKKMRTRLEVQQPLPHCSRPRTVVLVPLLELPLSSVLVVVLLRPLPLQMLPIEFLRWILASQRPIFDWFPRKIDGDTQHRTGSNPTCSSSVVLAFRSSLCRSIAAWSLSSNYWYEDEVSALWQLSSTYFEK